MYGYKSEMEFNTSVELNIIGLAESNKRHDSRLDNTSEQLEISQAGGTS
jgi:hypothetical protein